MEIRSAIVFPALFLVVGVTCKLITPPHVVRSQSEDGLVSDLSLVSPPDNDLKLTFTALGEKYSLELELANSLFSPEFKITYLSKSKTLDLSKEVVAGNFYTGKDGSGSYYIETVDGQIRVDGIVNDQVRIWHENGVHKAHRISNDQLTEAFAHDFIFQSTLPDKSEGWEFPDKLPPLPKVVTVEVFALVDSVLHQSLKKKDIPAQKYLGLLWNHVQTKYKTVTKPKIEFVVVRGSILPEKEWINSTIVKKGKPPVVNSHIMLSNFGEWLYSVDDDDSTPNYDIAILHTGMDLASPQRFLVDRGNLGVAYFTGVCSIRDDLKKVEKVGIMEDLDVSLKFQGVIVVAHEVAHLLGAPHDDAEPKHKKCPNNYIMYYAVGPSTIEKFSQCSIDSMREHLSKSESQCVRHEVTPTTIATPRATPSTTPSGPKPSPGRILPDDVCKRCFGDEAKAADPLFQGKEDPCENLYCQVSGNKPVPVGEPSPDGMICGENKVCKDCVCEEEFKPCR